LKTPWWPRTRSCAPGTSSRPTMAMPVESRGRNMCSQISAFTLTK
jgi:hypothetical protein